MFKKILIFILLTFSLILVSCNTVENKKLYVDTPNKSITEDEATPKPIAVQPTPTPQQEKTYDNPSIKPDDKDIKPSEAPKPQETPESSKKKQPKTSFKLGDTGDKVKEIQQRLNKYGYKLAVDGDFGRMTHSAVINFQKRLGLSVDGIVGPATMAKLNAAPTAATMYKPDSSAPGFSYANATTLEAFINGKGYKSNTNYYIWVDTKNKKVNIFQGTQGEWKLVRSMLCTVGAPSTPTVKGFFSVKDKGTMFRVDSSSICKYWTRFHNGYLFHTVLLNNDGSIKDGRLGMQLSRGCVRLSIEDAKYIYEKIPAGTAVWSN
jgi:lipoprotein-anchoring transpeptidase ErfK/SrfK